MTDMTTVSTLDAVAVLTFEATADRKALSAAVEFCSKFAMVSGRCGIANLANVVLEGTPEGLRVRSTDLDLQATYDVPGLPAIGAVTVNAKAFKAALAVCDEATVRIAVEEGKPAVLESGTDRHRMATLPVDDYPTVTAPVGGHTFDMPVRTLEGAFGRLTDCISTESTRYYLNGIFMHTTRDSLTFAATDGHKLGRVVCPKPVELAELCESDTGGRHGLEGILPTELVKASLKALSLVDGTAVVTLSGTCIQIDLGRIVLTCKLIDGTFPDYTRVMPAPSDRKVTVDAKALAKAAGKIVTLGAAVGTKTKAVRLHQGADRLDMTFSSPEGLNSTVSVEIAEGGLQGGEIGFNAAYLKQLLGNVQGAATLTLGADAGCPMLLTGTKGPDLAYVLMPMRV